MILVCFACETACSYSALISVSVSPSWCYEDNHDLLAIRSAQRLPTSSMVRRKGLRIPEDRALTEPSGFGAMKVDRSNGEPRVLTLADFVDAIRKC